MKKTVLCLSKTCPGHQCAVTYLSGHHQGEKSPKRKKKTPTCATQNTLLGLGCGPEQHFSLPGRQLVASSPGAGQQGLGCWRREPGVTARSPGGPCSGALPLQRPLEILCQVAPPGDSRFDRG